MWPSGPAQIRASPQEVMMKWPRRGGKGLGDSLMQDGLRTSTQQGSQQQQQQQRRSPSMHQPAHCAHLLKVCLDLALAGRVECGLIHGHQHVPARSVPKHHSDQGMHT